MVNRAESRMAIMLNYLTDDERLRRAVKAAKHEWHRRYGVFTMDDLVGPWKDSPDWTQERQANATKLIAACTKLQEALEADGIHFPLNPHTGTTISGETYGGFRPQDCPIGAPDSAHKQGLAVDRYDPNEQIDQYLLRRVDLLTQFGIYIEAPSSTPGWSHWSIRAPGSGHHIFYP